MKPYPRYKPTGLAWLPSVPEHWEATKIRTIFTERTTKVSDKDYPPLSVSKGGVVPQIETVAKSDDSDNRKLVRIGDFVINSRSDRKGSSGVSELDGSVSLVNLVLKPRKKGNGRFLHYLLKSDPFVEEFYRNGHGIVADLWTTRYSEMKSIYIPLPPPSEQDRIVRYLDEKTAAIDELVRAKERQIELLRERKQALVSAAVTGREEAGREGRAGQEGQATPGTIGTPETSGPSVPEVPSVPNLSSPSRPSCPASPGLRDSGVPWIGKIPKGWIVVKLSRRYSVQLGKMLDAKKIKGQSLMPYLRNQDVQWEGVNSEDLPKMDFSAEEQVRFGVRKGDLLVCEGGEIGRCAIWDSDKPCCFQKAIIRLRPRKPAEDFVRFMWYLMFAATANHAFDFATGKATIAHLPAEKLSAAQFAFPPLPEQERIVAHLDSVCSELDAAEAAIRKQIALLQELRTRLVSDAVTGAVEV